MDLKKFLEKVKLNKIKNSLLALTYDILKLEEVLVESTEKEKEIKHLGDILQSAFIIVSENKIEINNKVELDLDLDNWKNNIKKYKITHNISKEVYLYALRDSLKNLIKAIDNKNEVDIKTFIFELIIKTFLYIDFENLSIDHILEKQMKSIVVEKKIEIKES